MSGAQSFTDLLIWQRARAWSKTIFQFTKQEAFREDRRLVTQINASSASVMANIAEGFGRGTQGEFTLFLGYSIGSLDETRSHLTVAYDREYITRDCYGNLFSEGTAIRKMTVSFISSMIMPGSGVKHASSHPDWSERVWQVYERYTGNPRPEIFRQAAEQKRRLEEEARRSRRHRKTALSLSRSQTRDDSPPQELPDS
jgi:four helix bundle protein